MRIVLLAAATLLLSVGCAGDLSEIYDVPGRFPCASDADCVGSMACGPSDDDPTAMVCQPGCSVHSECADSDGSPGICAPSGTCMRVRSDLCATVEGPIGEDDVIIIGALTPQTDYGDRELASVLAVREFNGAGGLAGGRRLALIGCDDEGRPEVAAEAAEYLAAIGVPAVVGPYFSGVFIETFRSVLRGAGIFTISPSATSPAITELEDDGLAWRTISSDLGQSQAIVELVTLRAPTKVVMLAKDDAYGGYLLSEVSGPLVGMLGTDGFLTHNYPENDQDVDAVISAAFDPDADMVVFAGTSELPALLLRYEQEVAATGSTPPRYIFSEGGKNNGLLDAVAGNADLIARVEGTDPSLLNGEVYDRFSARYFADVQSQPTTFSANAYDAVYVIGHALNATTGLTVTGAEIAASISLLTTGSEIVNTDPSEIGRGRTSLSNGTAINLNGTSGSLDFDLQTGDTSTGITAWGIEERAADDRRFTTLGTFQLDGSGSGTWIFSVGM